ncbi:response regulator [Tsuneonella deserti]|uniref:Response regulator n=1 Tax=Tsuneonella deserti TaxID=2035528 RepID=A0ABQ1RYB4_9SPHN|nr:response regulator [Tsuneonella deserti]GGD84389.1 response regulator [Tsuneonella deserti]
MSEFEGKRILVLEDEPLIAMILEDVLQDLGCAVVGPVYDVAEAEALARDAPIDAAILDIHVGDHTSHSVAERFAERGVPFVVASGSDEAGELPGAAGLLGKPFNPAMVKLALERLFP